MTLVPTQSLVKDTTENIMVLKPIESSYITTQNKIKLLVIQTWV